MPGRSFSEDRRDGDFDPSVLSLDFGAIGEEVLGTLQKDCYIGRKEKGVPNMIPRTVNCAASDWQNSLRSMLSQKVDVDLTNVSIEFDGVYLEELAKENAMHLIKDENLKTVIFRKNKI